MLTYTWSRRTKKTDSLSHTALPLSDVRPIGSIVRVNSCSTWSQRGLAALPADVAGKQIAHLCVRLARVGGDWCGPAAVGIYIVVGCDELWLRGSRARGGGAVGFAGVRASCGWAGCCVRLGQICGSVHLLRAAVSVLTDVQGPAWALMRSSTGRTSWSACPHRRPGVRRAPQ